MLKLILSVDALSPTLSGIGRYTWELASRMEPIPEIKRIRFFRAGRWVNDPASLLRAAVPSYKHNIRSPRWVKNLYWRHACHGQVFHSPNYFLPPYAENGVVTVHDLSVFKFPEMHPVERVKQFEKMFQQTLNIAAHLITDSETTRREVIDFFCWPAERITAVHLGAASSFVPRSADDLAPELIRFGLKPEGYSLCVATIEPRKRIDSLLVAYSRLPTGLRTAYPLVLVGHQGWRNERLHELIKKGRHAGWLHYFGFVSDEDLHLLYAGARLFAYPSIYEGFGLPVVEAMASGVPVVTSDRSCLPEVSAGAAMLVDPDDIVALASGLEEGLLHSAWRKKAIVSGLHVASRYNWNTCIKQTAAVYANISP